MSLENKSGFVLPGTESPSCIPVAIAYDVRWVLVFGKSGKRGKSSETAFPLSESLGQSLRRQMKHELLCARILDSRSRSLDVE